ncbi:MAG: phosphotransferase [Parvibaculum sp.]|nr:phosphotransferase [Parvibaculum sp.]
MTSRDETIRAFLDKAGWGDATRRDLAGDASTRRYERLTGPKGDAVLMDWPRAREVAVPSGEQSYSQIAHLATDIRPFVAVCDYLHGRGLAAPEIFARDLDAGLLLSEDLGDDLYGPAIDAGVGPSGVALDEMYATAIETLLSLQSHAAPVSLPVGDGTEHEVPHFDDGIFRAELDVPLDWYFPHVLGHEASGDERAEYHGHWTNLRPLIDAGPRTLFLRDFHSPNIIWLKRNEGVKRVGIIDFQDALIGSRAYDVVSFLQDARKDVSVEREQAMLALYVARAKSDLTNFNEEEFRAAYAALGAERALRLIGLWPRLLHRDGKAHYMAHMPRTMGYLRRNLAHPALAPLRKWLDANMLPKT